MKTLTHDGRLTDALAALLGYLEAAPHPALAEALRTSADAFVDALAEHLRREEDVLFPALREASPAADEILRPLTDEHGSLRVFASELARRVAVDDREGAKEVARSFLAALAEHLEREEKTLGGFLDRLHPRTTDRLLREAGLYRGSEEED